MEEQTNYVLNLNKSVSKFTMFQAIQELITCEIPEEPNSKGPDHSHLCPGYRVHTCTQLLHTL